MTNVNVAELTSVALRECGTERLPAYERSLHSACEAMPPPFGSGWYGDSYRELAMNPYWLIQSLVSNSAKEGDGARELWKISSQIGDPGVSEEVRLHAIDESRHARYYISLLCLAFPESVSQEVLREMKKLSPGYRLRDQPPRMSPLGNWEIIDLLIQTNLGEIRTRIHQLLMRPVIQAYCPPDRRRRMQLILDTLLADETRHIQYTARLIEQACVDGDEEFVHWSIKRRLDQFNQVTLMEAGSQVFHVT